VLPGLGVAYVVVELTTPGPGVGSALDGMVPVVRGDTLELWSVPAEAAPAEPASVVARASVALSYVLAGLVLVTSCLVCATAWRGMRREGGSVATLPAVDESKEDT
jgi:hypothetical protein